MSEETSSQQSNGAKKPRKRSPSFPFIDLETAVGRAETFYEKNQDYPAPPEIAVTYWDYSKKSSGGRQTLAALKHYGLMDTNDDGEVLLTERGLDVAMTDSPKRDEALRKAAIAPDEFKDLWDSYGENLPETGTLRHKLLRERQFNPNSVDDFIENYRKSIKFGKPRKSDTMHHKDGALGDNGGRQVPAIGDLIQWESQGIHQFPEPRRVRSVTEDQQWVFVEGSETGLPASEVTIVTQAPKEPEMPNVTPIPPTLPLATDQADTFLLTIPFKGKSLSVQVKLPGETLGSEHFKKIKKHLDLLIDEDPN